MVLRSPDAEELFSLRRKVLQLEEELTNAHQALRDARKRGASEAAAMLSLQKALDPFYKALRMIYGEMEDAGVGGEVGTDAMQPIPEGKYAAWKQRLGDSCSAVIDALLVEPMSHKQLIGYCKRHYNTIAGALKTLQNNSLIEKNGTKWSLKR